MIYTCTLNPAIDLFVDTDQMLSDHVNRTNSYNVFANGKGVNVSFILKMLNIDSIAIGIGGGFTSQFIEDTLTAKDIKNDFVHIDGTTRINVFTRVESTNEEFKLVNKGPHVTTVQVAQLIAKVESLTANDTLVISGSFATGISPKILILFGQLSQKNGFKLVIDTDYATVLDTLPYHPYLLKPNTDEIAKWFNIKGTLSIEQLLHYSHRLVQAGAQNILLSLGSSGAILMNKEITLLGNAPTGKVVNTACSGDTMLGTFLAGMCQNKDLTENLAYSIAAGSSTAFTSGLTDFSNLDSLLPQINIHQVNQRLELL